MTMFIDDRQRVIGKVVSVTADRLSVEMLGTSENFHIVGYDDIHYIARLGSFIMIPVQANYVVAEVIGISEKERSSRDQRSASELDKSGSARFLELVPVGTLTKKEFRFGVPIFPSLYSDALYATEAELDQIFQVDGALEKIPEEELSVASLPFPWPTRLRALDIGKSAVFRNYDVKVRIDEFFGGHIAVLGNTGSGKSCTVAAMVQSLFMKEPEYVARGATFVLFDVNGEYRKAFTRLPSPIRRKLFYISSGSPERYSTGLDERETAKPFKLPHWLMSVEEWELLLMASERTQRPILRTALGLASLFSAEAQNATELRNHILASCIQSILASDASAPSKHDHVMAILRVFGTDELTPQLFLDRVNMHYGQMNGLDEFLNDLQAFVLDDVKLPEYRNLPFRFSELEGALDMAILHEEAHGNKQIRDYCASMLTRFKWVRDRPEFEFLRIDPHDLSAQERELSTFMADCLGLERNDGNVQKSHQVIVFDLNENDDDTIAVLTSVISRLVFELLRTANPRNRLPVNLILEEAHRYIAERPAGHVLDASRIFERVAKEGRKYGMFLLVASQRPSELSRTVLSQCSNFVVHRIQNPEDLANIRQMTPFISDVVLRRLPSLPKQHALIFGNAVNMPMTVRVRDADPTPDSADAQISKLWFHAAERPIELSAPFAISGKATPPRRTKSAARRSQAKGRS